MLILKENNLVDYDDDSHENLLKAVKKENVLKSGKGERRKEFMGHRTWDWLKRGSLKKETESVVIAAQDQAISTNNIGKNIFKEDFIHVSNVWKI